MTNKWDEKLSLKDRLQVQRFILVLYMMESNNKIKRKDGVE